MINDKRNCNLCNQNNYVSIIYGRYVACDVCIRILISTAIVSKVDERAKELTGSEEE